MRGHVTHMILVEAPGGTEQVADRMEIRVDSFSANQL